MSQAMSREQSGQRNTQIRQSFEGGGGASSNDLVHYLKQFAEDNPTSAAMWCFAIGFVVGWKLKPW